MSHPSTMTAEQIEELRKSDPSAFDEEPKEAKDEENETDPDGEQETENESVEAKGEEADSKEAKDEDEPAEGKKAPSIPKARFDEVNQARKAAEALSRQLAAELEEARARVAGAKAPKDFDAEFEAIESRLADASSKYDAGELDAAGWTKAQADHRRELRALQKEETAWNAQVAANSAQQESAAANVARTWREELVAWEAENPGFLTDDKGTAIKANEDVLQRAINAIAAFRGNSISHRELLAEAAELAFREVGYEPPQKEAPATEAGKQKAEARRAQNAQRATAAGNAPPPNTSGVGTRARAPADVDLRTMKPGTMSKNLTKAQIAEMLGGADAL